jgi:hypothetical protein
MNTSSNLSSNIGKNMIDSSLHVNCTFDMDYLEVTKNESLKKYEENVYLLGTIFNSKTEKKKKEGDENISLSESDDSSSSCSSSDIDENSILELFSIGIKNQNSEDLLKNITEKIILENQNHDTDKMEVEGGEENKEYLIEHLKESLKDIQEHELILRGNKQFFEEHVAKYNELLQRLKVNKNLEQNDLTEILEQSEQMGILSNTYKQVDNFIREKETSYINSDLPWEMNSNIIILPL